MFFEVFLEMLIKNKVVIESKQGNNIQSTCSPLEILKKEGNYNAKLQYDSDVVMYPIANFYRLSIDDESETEYTANVSSSSSVINSLPTDSDTVDTMIDEIQEIRTRDVPENIGESESEEQENIRKKTLMNMKMRSLKIPKGSNIHGFDILDLGNDEIREGDIAENYKNSGLQTENNYSINKLIERMTSEGTQEIEFTKIFLIFYRKFLRPSELLDLLMDRFEQYDNSENKNSTTIHPVQLRVWNVLIHWISEYWSDFQNPKMRFTIQVFLDVCSCRPSFSILCSKLENLIYRQPAVSNESEITWGIPDNDESEPTTPTDQLTSNTSSNTITTNNVNYNKSNSTTTLKSNINGNNSIEEHSNSSSESLNNNEMLTINDALKMNKTTNKSNNNLSPFKNNTNEIKTLSKASSCNTLNPNDLTHIKGKTNRHSYHSSHSSVNSMDDFNLKKPYSTDPSAMSLAEPSEFILNQDNTIIAQQLCLIEFEIFKRIKPRDLLQHIWGKRSKNSVASSSVAASIEHFNFISSW
jgi:hypothetical protein